MIIASRLNYNRKNYIKLKLKLKIFKLKTLRDHAPKREYKISEVVSWVSYYFLFTNALVINFPILQTRYTYR